MEIAAEVQDRKSLYFSEFLHKNHEARQRRRWVNIVRQAIYFFTKTPLSASLDSAPSHPSHEAEVREDDALAVTVGLRRGPDKHSTKVDET